MIVIFLIGLIGGVVGYNMKGSLDKGRAFKTEQAISKVKELLQLCLAEGRSISDPKAALDEIGLCDSDKLLKDGWNKNLEITINGEEIEIHSAALDNYNTKKK